MLVSKLMSELEKSSFCPSSSNRYYYLCNVDLCVFLYLSCLWFFQSGSFCDVFILTIISLRAQPVLLGASGDEKSPSLVVTGDPAGSKPADTHLFQVFFESTLPCLFRPPPPPSFFCRLLPPSRPTLPCGHVFLSAIGRCGQSYSFSLL